jgi:hypothetical protein
VFPVSAIYIIGPPVRAEVAGAPAR